MTPSELAAVHGSASAGFAFLPASVTPSAHVAWAVMAMSDAGVGGDWMRIVLRGSGDALTQLWSRAAPLPRRP